MTVSSAPATQRPLTLLVASLPVIVVALTALATTLFAFMQTDDFCTFGRVAAAGGNPLPDVATLYTQWTGRYSSIFAMTLLAAVGNFVPVEAMYPLALLTCALAFLWACIAASRFVNDDMGASPLWAVCAFGAIMLLMPSKLEQYLWLTGATVYFLGASLLLMLIARVADAQRRPFSWREETGTAALIVAVVGFNEFVALMVGACIALQAINAMRDRTSLKPHVFRLLIFAVALATTVLAPGNFARDSSSTLARHDVGAALSIGWESMRVFAERLGSDPAASFAALLACAAVGMLLKGSTGSSPRSQWLPWVALLVLAVPLHLFVYPFLVGEAAPGRVLNQAFLMIGVAGLIVAGRTGRAVARRTGVPSFGIGVASLGIAGLALLASPTYRTLLATTVEFAPTWRAQQLERHAGLRSLRGTRKAAYVKPFALGDANPPIYAGGDVGPDPRYWVNQCAAGYYGVGSIIQMRRNP